MQRVHHQARFVLERVCFKIGREVIRAVAIPPVVSLPEAHLATLVGR
jgi:hypothetical protein